MLDGKTIKTPYMNPLALPSEQLGFLVANEFNRQHKHLKTGEMPLLALSRTAVDADIEGHLAVHLRSTIIEYLKTDTLLFFDDRFEAEYHEFVHPLLDFFRERF
jgi:chaperone required for assembly of F1-ATPase